MNYLKELYLKGKKYEKKKNYFMAFECYCKVIRHSARKGSKNLRLYNRVIKKHDKLFNKLFFKNGKLVSIKDNLLLKDFKKDKKQKERIKKCNCGEDTGLLKEKKQNEKGIIFIYYNHAIERFALNYDLNKIKKDYKIIIFPSSSEYRDPIYYNYIGKELNVFIASPFKLDYKFIKFLKTNLFPVEIGPGDIIEPIKKKSTKKKYDICTFGCRNHSKNYFSLIKIIGQIKNNSKLKIFFAGQDKDLIKKLCKKYKVKSDIKIGWLDKEKWHKTLASSKVFILNSIKEGQSRVLTEALFTNCIIIVNKNCIGNNTKFINKKTGVFFTEKDFQDKLRYVLKNYKKFSPRKWALENTGCFNAIEKLNKIFKNASIKEKEPWTKDIVQFSYNNYLKYYNRKDKHLRNIKILDKFKMTSSVG